MATSLDPIARALAATAAAYQRLAWRPSPLPRITAYRLAR